MPEIIVDINISAKDMLAYYRGLVTKVVAIAVDGRKVEFPINLLRPFMAHSGVAGRFVIQYDANGKWQTINKQ